MANVRLGAWVFAIAWGCGLVAQSGSAAWAADIPEPPIAGVGKDADYLRLVHSKLHAAWVDSYIRMSPYRELGPETSSRQTDIRITLRWDGTIEAADLEKPSDSPDFDAAALNTVLVSGPFPPPIEVLADDGLAHLRWRFARDHRLCSGGEIVHVEFPLRMALPNLTARGQLEEVVRRMSGELAHQGFTGGDFLSPFARQWLARPNLSTDLDTRAAAALALSGDPRQVPHLEKAVLLPQVAGVAAGALDRLGVNIADMLEKMAGPDSGMMRRNAILVATLAVPSAAANCASCIDILTSSLGEPRQGVAVRLQIIDILTGLDRSEAIAAALVNAEKDQNVTIRAAALVANLPPGRTRTAVFRMSSLLHDPSPDIRAAAATGVLRAGGDAGLGQLYLIGREKDPRPLVAAATELGNFSSAESATMLGKLLKRPEKNVRVAAILALARRHDVAARKLVDPVLMSAGRNASEDPRVRELVMADASGEDLASMALDPRLGPAVYRTWLRSNHRPEAARWLLDNLLKLSPEDRIATLGDWIAQKPAYAARK
jgi:HEAT repeat protein